MAPCIIALIMNNPPKVLALYKSVDFVHKTTTQKLAQQCRTPPIYNRPINDFIQIITKFLHGHLGKHYPSTKGEWFRLVNNIMPSQTHYLHLCLNSKSWQRSTSKKKMWLYYIHVSKIDTTKNSFKGASKWKGINLFSTSIQEAQEPNKFKHPIISNTQDFLMPKKM